MEKGAEMFFDGLRKQVGPSLDELGDMAREMSPALRDFAARIGPALEGLSEQVGDWSAYEAPKILPNGDIIIRRKPSQTDEPPETGSEPPIDL